MLVETHYFLNSRPRARTFRAGAYRPLFLEIRLNGRLSSSRSALSAPPSEGVANALKSYRLHLVLLPDRFALSDVGWRSRRINGHYSEPFCYLPDHDRLGNIRGRHRVGLQTLSAWIRQGYGPCSERPGNHPNHADCSFRHRTSAWLCCAIPGW